MIHALRPRLLNVQRAVGLCAVLSDTGGPANQSKIQRRITPLRHFLPATIFLTHTHADCAGAAPARRCATSAPIGHDQPVWALAAAGRKTVRHHARPSVMSLKFSVPACVISVIGDFAQTDGIWIADFGMDACLMTTTSHTAGSFSTPFADRTANIDDLLMNDCPRRTPKPRRRHACYFIVVAIGTATSPTGLSPARTTAFQGSRTALLKSAHQPQGKMP